MELFDVKGCLSEEGLQALVGGQLDETQRLEAAEHLAYCDRCMDRYTALLTDDVLEQPPRSARGAVMGTIWIRLMQNTWGRAAVAGVAAVLAFTIMSGLYFVRSIVVPLGQVERTAAGIARGELDVRLPLTGDPHDEVDRLRGTINQMAEGLEETEKMKNEFISSVSHELRTPLTSIRGWVETLMTLDDPTDENYRKGLEIINNETGRLNNMVEELLDFSRLQNGRIRMECRPLDLVAELTDAVLFCEARIRQEGLLLHYTEPEEMIPVYADPDRLRQVFINIMDNAIKYSAPGGRITVKLWAGEYKAFVEIIDQGRGIPPEDLPYIFDRYYRSRSDAGKQGTGLGLSITKAIFQQHSFRFGVQSTVGKGTTFWFVMSDLPYVDDFEGK